MNIRYVSPRTHSIVGFIVGIALLLAPNIFMFSDVGGAAVMVPRVIGIIVMLSELTVQGSFSKIGFIPMKLHLVADVLLGAVLALSPFLFGFSDLKANAWVPHLVVGLLIIGYAFVTRTGTNDRAVSVA